MSGTVNVAQLAALINKGASIRHDKLIFNVTIKEVAIRAGRIQYLVAPVSGSGELWTTHIEELTPIAQG